MDKTQHAPARPHGSGKVFKNNALLEALTKTSPGLVWSLYSPIWAGLLIYDLAFNGRAWWMAAALFFGALFVWTFVEYGLHRYIFHIHFDNKYWKKFHYLAHGFHHDHPRDKDHLYMPIPVGYGIAVVFGVVFYFLIGDWTFSFLPGFMVGYLGYSTLHYYIHAVKHPPKPLRGLWKHHLLHHFKDNHRAFGVSTTLWDHVLGTMPRKK